MRRYNNKKDLIHDETVALLRKSGVVVWNIDEAMGVDLLCGHRGRFFLLELKSKGGKLTTRQDKLQEICNQTSLPFFVLYEGEPVSRVLDQLTGSPAPRPSHGTPAQPGTAGRRRS